MPASSSKHPPYAGLIHSSYKKHPANVSRTSRQSLFITAVHPVTGEYYYNTILGYGWSFLTNDISVYDLGSGTPKMVADYRNYTHFPAGIFFTAGF